MAFVSSFIQSIKPASSSTAAFAAASPLAARRTAVTARPVMMADMKEKIKAENATFRYLEENRRAKEESLYTPQRGFTDAAETLNGRMAMMGFAIGLVTELITGQGINAQLAALFEPLSKLHM